MFELKKFSHRKEAIVAILILAVPLAILYFAKVAGLEPKQLDLELEYVDIDEFLMAL